MWSYLCLYTYTMSTWVLIHRLIPFMVLQAASAASPANGRCPRWMSSSLLFGRGLTEGSLVLCHLRFLSNKHFLEVQKRWQTGLRNHGCYNQIHGGIFTYVQKKHTIQRNVGKYMGKDIPYMEPMVSCHWNTLQNVGSFKWSQVKNSWWVAAGLHRLHQLYIRSCLQFAKQFHSHQPISFSGCSLSSWDCVSRQLLRCLGYKILGKR